MTAGRTFPRWMPTCSAVLVLLQLGAVVHLAAAPHAICPEHGLAIEVDGIPAGGQTVAAPALPGMGRAPVASIRSNAHPHCPALWVLRQARPEVASSALVRTELPAGVPPRASAAEPHRWALHRAPKQSPPA